MRPEVRFGLSVRFGSNDSGTPDWQSYLGALQQRAPRAALVKLPPSLETLDNLFQAAVIEVRCSTARIVAWRA